MGMGIFGILLTECLGKRFFARIFGNGFFGIIYRNLVVPYNFLVLKNFVVQVEVFKNSLFFIDAEG